MDRSGGDIDLLDNSARFCPVGLDWTAQADGAAIVEEERERERETIVRKDRLTSIDRSKELSCFVRPRVSVRWKCLACCPAAVPSQGPLARSYHPLGCMYPVTGFTIVPAGSKGARGLLFVAAVAGGLAISAY